MNAPTTELNETWLLHRDGSVTADTERDPQRWLCVDDVDSSTPVWGDADASGDPVLGVLLRPGDDPRAHRGILDAPRIAVDFPSFADGRGLTWARLLRTELGYAGELRAVGDVGPDLLIYLGRVGFDSFALRAGTSPAVALSSLRRFTHGYLGARTVGLSAAPTGGAS